MATTEFASASELLTQQFYDWEIRGRGWMVWEAPVELEPPFRPFEGHVLPPNFFKDDGRESSFLTSMAERFLSAFNTPPPPIEDAQRPEEPPPNLLEFAKEEIVEIQFSLPRDLQPSPEVFEQCLFSLAYCHSPISFEVIGSKEALIVQVACQIDDSTNIFAQLKSHFPDAVLTPVTGFLGQNMAKITTGACEVHEFGLEREFMLPLRPRKELAVDPMVTLCGALEQLYEDELAIFQVLFQPVRNRWTENAWSALTTPDGDPFFEGEREMVAFAKRKLASPLFAVVIRAGVFAAKQNRTWEIIRAIAGTLRLFDSPNSNRLMLLKNDGYDDDDHREDIACRRSHRSGMLLSSDELIAIAHLPTAAVRSRKLAREIKRTKEIPVELTKSGVWLGINKHEGKRQYARLPDASRVEHMHVLGTQGTGKSTLLLNLICQDIYNGRGLAVLDPHGDLIDDILGYIPPERHGDVIIVDPADELYPIGFNILSAHSTIEKNLLASDLVAVFRRLSTSWGDQMSSVLGNAVLAFVENSRVGTLPELRRFFVEAGFRKEVLQTVTDPDIAYYWEKEFPLLKSNSLGPLLTRLDMFLRPKTIRYMVGQRENKIDFATIMNEGKILLARLSQGIIGEENGFLLGTLLVSKFHQIAISRQAVEAENRRPFFLYIDEFHHFVSPSMASILTGVRKYRLGLILAHQNLTQLKDADVANSVLSSPYARVCFRVGDQDAKRVAESFSYFESSDLLNLGRGEAICRIQKNDWDFNLETVPPPKPTAEEAKYRRDTLHYLTRRQYGVPREKVEEELAKSRVPPARERVDPFAARTDSRKAPERPKQTQAPEEDSAPPPTKPEADEEIRKIEEFYAKPEKAPLPPQTPPSEPKPASEDRKREASQPRDAADLGRGGEQHRAIQQRIKEAAEESGFRAIIEKEILNGGSHIDVVLERGSSAWACQVGVTNTIDHEVGQVRNCVKAGYVNIVVVSTKLLTLKKMESAVTVSLGAEVAKRVTYFLPDAFITELPSLVGETIPKQETKTSHGWVVTTETVVLSREETKMREEKALKALAAHELKRRKKKK